MNGLARFLIGWVFRLEMCGGFSRGWGWLGPRAVDRDRIRRAFFCSAATLACDARLRSCTAGWIWYRCGSGALKVGLRPRFIGVYESTAVLPSVISGIVFARLMRERGEGAGKKSTIPPSLWTCRWAPGKSKDLTQRTQRKGRGKSEKDRGGLPQRTKGAHRQHAVLRTRT